VTLALRTQQVLAYETGVAAVADPLGGSYFVERMTLDMEDQARDYIRRIDEMGGMIAAIERGFPQSEIANASYEYQRAVEAEEKIIVGVNRFQSGDQPIELLQVDDSAQRSQTSKLAALRERRDPGRVDAALGALRRSAAGSENTMPCILDAVRAYATLGEICEALRGVFGSYTETTHL
jgi:methylmalonyl-CoA mutase N-terminal domain/subunit